MEAKYVVVTLMLIAGLLIGMAALFYGRNPKKISNGQETLKETGAPECLVTLISKGRRLFVYTGRREEVSEFKVNYKKEK